MDSVSSLNCIYFHYSESCQAGHFYDFDKSSCQKCPVNHYQGRKAQVSCIPCPKGTYTRGREASKSRHDCHGGLHLLWCFSFCCCFLHLDSSLFLLLFDSISWSLSQYAQAITMLSYQPKKILQSFQKNTTSELSVVHLTEDNHMA